MVFISKGLLEIIISRREHIKKQKENPARQKELDLQTKLTVMQQSTDKQLDEKVSGKNVRLFQELSGQFLPQTLIL